MRLWLLAVVVLVCTLVAACTGSSNTSPSPTPTPAPAPTPTPSATCRSYPISATEVSNAGGLQVNGIMVTGSFDSSTLQFTSTVVYPNGSLCDTVVTSYRSIADLISEVKVIPPLTLATQSITTGGPACGSGTSTRVYSYDSQQRLTRYTQGSGTGTYSGWDSAGRPTVETLSSGASILYAYNDAARTTTVTTTSPGGMSGVVTLTYDANGILLQEAGNGGTTTWTTLSTGKICK